MSESFLTPAHKGYSRQLRYPGGGGGGGGHKACGVPQPKPMQGLSPNFQGIFTPRGSRADLVLGDIQY